MMDSDKEMAASPLCVSLPVSELKQRVSHDSLYHREMVMASHRRFLVKLVKLQRVNTSLMNLGGLLVSHSIFSVFIFVLLKQYVFIECCIKSNINSFYINYLICYIKF